MLPAVAAFGIAFFCLTLWCSVTVARMRDIPTWRRFLPLGLFLTAAGASLLRAFDIPEVADAVAVPLNLAVVLLPLREIRGRRQHRQEAGRPAQQGPGAHERSGWGAVGSRSEGDQVHCCAPMRLLRPNRSVGISVRRSVAVSSMITSCRCGSHLITGRTCHRSR